MVMSFFVLALVFFAVWIFAEFKAGKGARLALGVVCMVMLFVGMALGQLEAAVYFAHTNMWYKDSLTYIAVLIERDHAEDIPPAIARYEATLSGTQDHLSAASDLKGELIEAIKALEDNTDGATQEK